MRTASPRTAAISIGLVGALALAGHLAGSVAPADGPGLALVPTAWASSHEKAGTPDATPRGRTPAPIVDGVYPASYFPNTELLGGDEMRITALGTGMPNQAKKAASISYLVELGNGDKFLFDIGLGSMANLFALRPDFSKLDKVFVSHLHVDHVGDFMGLHVGSWLSGRYTPIHIYGPTGSKGLPVGHPQPHRSPARRGRADRGPRVRLPAGERGRLPAERRDDPVVAGHPHPGRLGDLQPRVERPEVRVRRRYLSQQVVHAARTSPRTSASSLRRRWRSISAGI
jgi:hypothetical protein